MRLQINVMDRVLIAAPEGELDHLHAERLKSQIDAAFEKSPCKHIILDMKRVSFMDSSGIGMIIGRYKNVEKQGGQLALANMSETVAKLFEISGLAKIILRAKTLADALELIGGGYSA